MKNFRSIVLAATERDHGAKFVTVARPGPSLPAAIDVNIPFRIAWKAPMAFTSSKYLRGSVEPTEKDMI